MNSALWYLLLRSSYNNVRHRVVRLRQPKYLVGAVFGGLYLYFYFYRFLFHGGRSTGGGGVPVDPGFVEIAAFVYFMALLALAWIFPGSRAAMRFSESEIAWLFPAPLARRTLLQYKLLQSQFGIVLFAVVMLVVSGRFRQGGAAWLHLLGWWVGLTIFSWHRIGASFALQRLRERGLSDGRRRVLFATGAALLAGVLFFIFEQLPKQYALSQMIDRGDWLAALHAMTANPALQIFLTPFRWCVQLYFVQDVHGLLLAALPALAMLVAHYAWVIRSDSSFEEASLALAQRRARLMASRARRAPFAATKAAVPAFSLGPSGSLSIAFFWKSLLKAGGKKAIVRWGRFGVLALAASMFVAQGHFSPYVKGLVPFLAYVFFLISVVYCTQFAAGQFRDSLGMVDYLKSLPMRGWQFVAGDLAGPLCLGLGCQALTLVLGGMSVTTFSHHTQLGPMTVGAWSIAIAVLLPGINLLMMTIPCALTLLFPAWFKPGEGRAAGIEATGLRVLMMLGQLLVLLLGLILPSIFGFGTGLALHLTGNGMNVAILSGAITAAVALTIEASWGVLWLGALFEKYDLNEQ